MRDRNGAAAVEMALIVPLLLLLIIGPLEMGNYFMDEHALAKGVRDGAIFAAHQNISNFDCTAATPTVPSALVTATKNVVRSGQPAGGTDRLTNWGSASFAMSLVCVTQSNTTSQTLSGIYVFNGGKVPVITITATLPYAAVLANLGLYRPNALTLTASQQATVLGI